MDVKQQLVPLWRRLTRTYRGTNPVLYIVVHMTGNTNAGADAQGHANYQSGSHKRKASWHETVDDTQAIQSYPASARAWHSGMGRDRGNMSGYAVEICVNSDGNYEQAVRNGAERVRQLRAENNVPLSNVIQHYDLSGKNCPTQLRDGKDGITWADFLRMCSTREAGHVTPVSNPAPAPEPTSTTKPPTNGDYTMQTIDLRNAAKSPVTGADMDKLQALLLAHGYGPAGLVAANGRPDGIGGTRTRSLFGAFQTGHPATGTNGHADYVCGDKSWRELIEG